MLSAPESLWLIVIAGWTGGSEVPRPETAQRSALSPLATAHQRNAVASLVDLGVLEPYGDARYDRLYWSRRVFQVIEP